MFQGLNFQLAAVLLSLGFYSYVEMSKFYCSSLNQGLAWSILKSDENILKPEKIFNSLILRLYSCHKKFTKKILKVTFVLKYYIWVYKKVDEFTKQSEIFLINIMKFSVIVLPMY